eukprot:TRINITY_DN14129_c0_g1_i1.p1 TRINITY_DN14129_c0_g1~~TRINITY_DN14129_c0_g1_i1.p1  ORF type:complete len:450 (+),score=123.51 TRINITY_DN14129_c0_g1_i1:138-1487(+)
MESLCVNCEEQGKTTMLLTKIPFFKEVIVVSFRCEECGYRNSEVTFGGKIAPNGLHIEFEVRSTDDYRREIVKSEFATVSIPEVGLEIPKGKGQISTVEGIVQKVIDDLETSQEDRRQVDPQTAAQIDEYLVKLRRVAEGQDFPFHFIIDDPAGNSFVQNPNFPKEDPQIRAKNYPRTRQQLEDMGFQPDNAIRQSEIEADAAKDGQINGAEETKKEEKVEENAQKEPIQQVGAHRLDFTKPLEDNPQAETMQFEVPCHACGEPGFTRMCNISVPYFKDLIIMAFSCDKCGAHNSEIKTGGEVSKLARRITLKAENAHDLKRDCFKSESAHLSIPELGLELAEGTLGGVYTTIEGLLEKIEENLKEKNPFVGDSDPVTRARLEKFFSDITDMREVRKPFTLIIDDPLDNSFIQNPWHPEPDPRVETFTYERTKEQNDELGFSDMKVDNY